MIVSRLVLLLLVVGCKKEEEKADEIPDGVFSLESPEAAAFMDEGTVKAEGTAENVDEVKVMGIAAEAKGGSFNTQIELLRGLNVVEATAVDGHGDTLFIRNGVLAGTFKQAEDMVEEAAQLRVNQSGLDKLCSVVEDAITPEVLSGALGGVNPIYSTTVDVWGWEAGSVNVDLEGVDFGRVGVEITPDKGNLHLSASIPDLVIDLYAYGDALGYELDTTMAMGADVVQIDADITLGTRDGKLTANLVGAEVLFIGFWYDTSLIPWDLEEYILVDTIAETIQGMIQEQILEMVPPLVEETLSGLAPSYETELLGHTTTIAWEFASATTDSDGLALVMDLGVDIEGKFTKSSPGFLGVPSADPTISRTAEVAGAISDDLLNRVLFEAWGAGMLDMRLGTDDGSLESFMLAPMHATSGSITTEAMLPPVMVEKDGKTMAQVGEMLVTIKTDDSDLGSFLDIALSAEVELELTVQDSMLSVEMGEPSIVMVVRDSDWGASNEATTELVEESLPLDLILALLGNIEFELPSLYGVAITEGTVDRDRSGYFTNITLGLGRVE
jgi:hypothetical protein